MDFAQIYNTFEIFLWSFIGMALLWRTRHSPLALKKNARLAAGALMVFALTDLMEIWTGAWWRPWWLLALNALCIAVMLFAGWRHHRISR